MPASTSPADGAARRPRFGARAVDPALIAQLLALARRAPSGVNTQPWKIHVLQQAARDALVHSVRAQLPQLCAQPSAQQRYWQQVRLWPGRLAWPGPDWERVDGGFLAQAGAAFGTAAFQSVQDLDECLDLYGAPVALVCTIERALGLGSVLDDGMFLHNVVMAAAVRDLQALHLPLWKGFGDTVCAAVAAPETELLVAVLALGAAPQSSRGEPSADQAAQVRAHTHWHD